MKKNQKGFTITIVLSIIFIVLVVVGVGIYILSTKASDSQTKLITNQQDSIAAAYSTIRFPNSMVLTHTEKTGDGFDSSVGLIYHYAIDVSNSVLTQALNKELESEGFNVKADGTGIIFSASKPNLLYLSFHFPEANKIDVYAIE